jgi:hypothetical protein
MLWKPDSGKSYPILVQTGYVVFNIHRDYTATYWPNKGIRGSELQKIHDKIVTAAKALTEEASPEHDPRDSQANGRMSPHVKREE